MNQMLQDPPADTIQTNPPGNLSGATTPVPSHPHFAKPQRIAFVQACWHREVVDECRTAFLDEIEARHIARDRVDFFEVPVFSAVLTPQQFHETQPHIEFFRKHFVVKGIEVAGACADTLLSLERLRSQVAAGIA